MGCVFVRDQNISELENAGVRTRAHRQALSALAQEYLGVTFRASDVQLLGRSDTSLYSSDRHLPNFPTPRKGILNKRRFEHDNAREWLKVCKKEKFKTSEVGLDTVNRLTEANLGLGVGLSAEFGLVPKVSASLSKKESAGKLEKKTIIEYRTHMVSIKDARHPLYNSEGLMPDVAKFCKDSATAWQTNDPMYGELYVDKIYVGGRLTISYNSTQGRNRVDNEEKKDDDDSESSSMTEKVAEQIKQVGQASAETVLEKAAEKATDKIQTLVGVDTKDEDGDDHVDGNADTTEQGKENDGNEDVASRSMSVGIKVDATSGMIDFGFQNTTSDDDWEFTIECEGGDTTIFKKTYRGKSGLEALNRCQAKWKKSIQKGQNPDVMKMDLVKLDYLAVAIATDPKKVQIRFEEIAHLLEMQEHKLAEQQKKISKMENRRFGKTKRSGRNATNTAATKTGIAPINIKNSELSPGTEHHHHYYHDPTNAPASTPNSSLPTSHRRHNSLDIKDELESKFQKTISLLRAENARLVDIEQAHGASIHLDDHHESLETLVLDLESDFTALVSNWMQDEDRIAEMEANGLKPHEQMVKRMKTITQNAVERHRLKVSKLRATQSVIGQDLQKVKSKVGEDFGAGGDAGASQKNAAGSVRKELKRPVTVFSRFRPLKPEVWELPPEQGRPPVYTIEPLDDGSGEVISKLQLHITEGKEYNLDKVFDDNAPLPSEYANHQEFTFANSAALLVPKMIEGFNVTLMAYGQTGSGKSFTMYGPGDKYGALATEPLRGMIPRLIGALLDECAAQKKSGNITGFEFSGQLYELYNEELNDLLCPARKKMKIVPDIMAKDARGRTSKRANWCKEATVFTFATTREALEAIGGGMMNRVVAKTNKNHTSSRSHAILALRCKTKGRNGDRIAKVNLIDLAGSEKRAATMGTKDEKARAGEGAAINLSLLTLGKIINMLAQRRKVGAGTFRESKLTRLLQDSLGGNAYLMMMTCMSPSSINAEMTRSTAQFGQRCRGMKNVTKVNFSKSIEEYEKDLKVRDEQLVMLGSAIKTLESHNIDLAEELDQAESLLDEITGKKTKESGSEGERGGAEASSGFEQAVPRPSQVLKTKELEKQIDSVKRRASRYIGSDTVKRALENAAAAEARITDAQEAGEEE